MKTRTGYRPGGTSGTVNVVLTWHRSMSPTVARCRTGDPSATGVAPAAMLNGTKVFHQISARNDGAKFPPSVRSVVPRTVTMSPALTTVGWKRIPYRGLPTSITPQSGFTFITTDGDVIVEGVCGGDLHTSCSCVQPAATTMRIAVVTAFIPPRDPLVDQMVPPLTCTNTETGVPRIRNTGRRSGSRVEHAGGTRPVPRRPELRSGPFLQAMRGGR